MQPLRIIKESSGNWRNIEWKFLKEGYKAVFKPSEMIVLIYSAYFHY